MSDYKSIKLDKGLYTGKGFSHNLEQLDPSENYKGTSLEGLDAFSRQLKRFDIKINGSNCDVVDKFFSSSQTAALFPEFVVRAVSNGIDNSDTLKSICAVVTKINGFDYRSITSDITDTAPASDYINEGAQLPEVNISLAKNLVGLHKYGRMLVTSYEALRFQKIGVLSIALRQIGEYIAHQQLNSSIDVLVNGNDGNTPCENFNLTSDLKYSDLIELWSMLGQYKMTTLMMSPDTAAKLLNMPEFRDASAGLDFHATGRLITPFGAQIIKSNFVDNLIIAFDKNATLEMVQSGDVTVDTDKLIDCQLERVAISSTCGFNRITADAVKTITLN